MKTIWSILCVTLFVWGTIVPASTATSGLVSFNDDDLVQLIKEDEFVIVLFGKSLILFLFYNN